MTQQHKGGEKPQKLILIKDGQLAIKREMIACYCDFCGKSKGKIAFTSSFEDEMQICESCVRQLTNQLK